MLANGDKRPHPPVAWIQVDRVILHVDLDAFYASVEQRDAPALRGRPVLVGGTVRRGVVAACSYEARRFGIHSAMPMAEAVRRCPEAVVLVPRMEHYAEISGRFFAILEDCSPLVEGLSLDEAFVDVTGEERLLGDGPTIARHIKERVRTELGLVASVGVAPSKFIAKIASDLGKPDGLLEVRPEEIARFLSPLPVGRLWGVGRVTEAELAALGLATIGDLSRLVERDPAALTRRLGEAQAAHLSALARGIDERAVTPEREPVSFGHEDTFDEDLFSVAALTPHLLRQGDRAAARMRRHGRKARTITVKVKYADHRLITRRSTLNAPTDDARRIAKVARELLAGVPDIAARGVRLTGVSLSGLDEETAAAEQLSFFEADKDAVPEDGRLDRALDAINARYGKDAVQRAVHVDPQPRRPRKGDRG